MKKTKTTFLKILLGISTILFFLQFTGWFGLISNFWTAIIFVLFGLVMFFFSFNRIEYIGIIGGVTLFISGIIIYVSYNYEILRYIDVLFPSLIFIVAVSFLMIHLTDRENNLTLITAMLLFITSYFLLTTWNGYYYIGIANRFLFYLIDFWPSILFITTLTLLVRNK